MSFLKIKVRTGFIPNEKNAHILETVGKVKNCGLLLGCYGDLLAVDGIRNVSQDLNKPK